MKTKQQKLEILYCIALVMLLLRQLSGMMAIVPYFSLLATKYGNIILYISCTLFGIIVLVNEWGKQLIPQMLLILWSLATYRISGTSIMMLAVLMLLSAHKLNKRNLILVWFWVMATVLGVAIISYIVMYPEQGAYIQYMGLQGVTRMRYYFFFNHPNSIALCMLYFMLAFVYLWQDKLPFGVTIGALVLGCVFEYLGPCSYTALAVLAVATIGIVWNHCWQKGWGSFAYVAAPMILGIAILGVLLFYFVNIEIPYNPITHTLVMRFEQGAAALAICPPNLWGQAVTYLGQDIEWHGKILNAVSLDMGYVALLIYYGLFGMILALSCVLKGYYSMLKHKEYMNALLLCVVLLYGMMEWPAIYPVLAFPLLLLSDHLQRN